MKRDELTEKILDKKREKALGWKEIANQVGGASPILVTAALLGQMRLTQEQASAAKVLFGLEEQEAKLLTEIPHRGNPTVPPMDPLLYRLYELVMIYGPSLKELIQEEFGDGIMSAIDLDLELARQPDASGDRLRLTISGKFLPYRRF